ncbi:ATP-binding protein [Desulforhopalus vacuolatus]|uniref:ATP-binding protein n=1 Tax=Desulforhopalus vacuolatus TaxID=40414 RepID=UPI0019661C93|nr:ATP-binding protein [Desulforhopalus vacuolatus]MBM9518886.1 ATP-binding protein [Desulforhopalus vacuolatus]
MSETDAHLNITADFDNLAEVTAFVCQRARELTVPELLWSKLELVVEEIFLNIVNHSRLPPEAVVDISCSLQKVEDVPDDMFCVSLRDHGQPFNPLKTEAPALEQDVDSRPIGGLGIYLVTQMTDHCSYARQDDSNIFSACFRMKQAG